VKNTMTNVDEYCAKLRALLQYRKRPEWTNDMEDPIMDELDSLWYKMSVSEMIEIRKRLQEGQLG
jgi:hypothetical protein